MSDVYRQPVTRLHEAYKALEEKNARTTEDAYTAGGTDERLKWENALEVQRQQRQAIEEQMQRQAEPGFFGGIGNTVDEYAGGLADRFRTAFSPAVANTAPSQYSEEGEAVRQQIEQNLFEHAIMNAKSEGDSSENNVNKHIELLRRGQE